MRFQSGSRLLGTQLAFATLALTLASAANAEAITTVNGVDVDSAVFELYFQSRTQKPTAQGTPDELAAVQRELTDIYMLATQPAASELEKESAIQAQIELQYRSVLAQAVAGDFLSNNQATEEEIFAMYTQQIEMSPTSQYKARHILVETQGQAVELIGQLDTGADFEQLATDNSTGPSGPNGGDLGWFSSEQMVPEFSNAVAALEDGGYTKEPVQTQFGWHVIMREETRANEPPTLESVRDVIKQNVEQSKFQTYIEGLRSPPASTE